MAGAIIDAMLSPEGLIVGAAWVAVWTAILSATLLIQNALGRRRCAGLNMGCAPLGEGQP